MLYFDTSDLVRHAGTCFFNDPSTAFVAIRRSGGPHSRFRSIFRASGSNQQIAPAHPGDGTKYSRLKIGSMEVRIASR